MQAFLARWPAPLQWLALALASVLFAAALLVLRLPAALLLGPMLAGILAGTHGASVRVDERLYVAAQALIGVMIANTITPGIAGMFAAHWAVFLGMMLATLAASSALGVVLTRLRLLPGTTAIWGLTPGAATAMVLMAESFGADARLVAFMQYLRVIFVAFVAAGIAHLWLHTGGAERTPFDPFVRVDLPAFAATLAVALAGAWLGLRLRIQAGALLVPAMLAIALHLGGWLRIELPPLLLACVYALVGWMIGLRFTRETLRYALRALPAIVIAIVALIALCGALSWLLARLTGADALTAYLAMSPGGMDTVAIIAASSSGIDLPFIMALQAVRLVAVILFGPRLARAVARLQPGAASQATPTPPRSPEET